MKKWILNSESTDRNWNQRKSEFFYLISTPKLIIWFTLSWFKYIYIYTHMYLCKLFLNVHVSILTSFWTISTFYLEYIWIGKCEEIGSVWTAKIRKAKGQKCPKQEAPNRTFRSLFCTYIIHHYMHSPMYLYVYMYLLHSHSRCAFDPISSSDSNRFRSDERKTQVYI